MKIFTLVLSAIGIQAIATKQFQIRTQPRTFLFKDCPPDMQVKCMDDINRAVPICEKAAEQKGKDLPADLDCVKFLLSADKDCWGCICTVAEKNHWKIKGCDKYLME